MRDPGRAPMETRDSQDLGKWVENLGRVLQGMVSPFLAILYSPLSKELNWESSHPGVDTSPEEPM